MTCVRPRSRRLVRSVGDPSKVYRLRKERGTLARTPVDRARAHVAHLLDLGLTKEAIARVAGVSPGHVARVLTDPDKKLIDRRVEAALLRVTHRPHPAQAVCLAIGAQRRAQALAAMGWSISWQAEQLGKRVTNYSTELRHVRLSYPTWVAVKDLYDRHSMTRGPFPVAAKRAHSAGWAPPLAWDDDTIDDPTATPDLGDAGPRRAGRPIEHVVEDIEWYLLEVDATATAEQVSTRLGFAGRSGVQNALLRAGRDDLLDRLVRNADLAGLPTARRRGTSQTKASA